MFILSISYLNFTVQHVESTCQQTQQILFEYFKRRILWNFNEALILIFVNTKLIAWNWRIYNSNNILNRDCHVQLLCRVKAPTVHSVRSFQKLKWRRTRRVARGAMLRRSDARRRFRCRFRCADAGTSVVDTRSPCC